MTKLRISELAQQTGVPSTTLRYYEQVGLLPADRTPSGYRVYDDEAVERLRFISAAKRMQLSLDSIRDLLQTWQDQPCRTVKGRLRPMVSSRLAETEEAITSLNDLAAGLRSGLIRLDALPDRDQGCDPSCAFLDASPVVPDPAADIRSRPSDSPACSLSGQEHEARIARWHALLARAAIIPIPLGVIVSLPSEAVNEITDLVIAELECCPFLDFQLGFRGHGIELRITGPNADAVGFIQKLVPDMVQ